MTTKKIPVRIYIEKDELAEIDAKKDQLGLKSRSEFIRLCSLSRPLPDTARQQDVLDLMKVNADLARLGNQLKDLLQQEDITRLLMMGKDDISKQLEAIENLRETELKPLIKKLASDGKHKKRAERLMESQPKKSEKLLYIEPSDPK